MADLGKGDWVQAIKSYACVLGEIVAGNTYYVAEVIDDHPMDGPCGWCGNRDGFLLLDAATPDGFGWCPCAFKPLGGNANTLTAPPVREKQDA